MPISVSDFYSYAFQPGADTQWRSIDQDTYSIILKTKDKVTGENNKVELVLVNEPKIGVVVLRRILINEQEVHDMASRGQLGATLFGTYAERKTDAIAKQGASHITASSVIPPKNSVPSVEQPAPTQIRLSAPQMGREGVVQAVASESAPPVPPIAPSETLAQHSGPSQGASKIKSNEFLMKYSVSYDCAKAGNSAEKSVCSDASLGRLDGLLAATFKSRSQPAFGTDPISMKKAQREWLLERNSCTDTFCIERSYRGRINQLCEIPVASGVRFDSDCDLVGP